MKQYYAAYDDEGKLTGLYNSEDHKPNQIPPRRIDVTFTRYLEIVARPNDFQVVNGKLRDSGISALPENAFSGAAMPAVKPAKYSSGFMYKGICYWADEASSDHVTQCLAIMSHDKEFKPKLKATVNGEIKLVDVNVKDLLAIAKGINELRLES